MTRLTRDQQADVERVIPGVWGVVRSTYRGRFTAFTADDVFQYTIESVCRARLRWDPAKSSWLNYALTRARGAVIDFLREERPGSRQYPALNPFSLDSFPHDPDGNSPLDKLDVHQDPEPPDALLEAQLWQAVDGLPGRCSNVFRLYAEADLTMAQVAELTGVTEARVSQIVKEARRRLQPGVRLLLEPVAA